MKSVFGIFIDTQCHLFTRKSVVDINFFAAQKPKPTPIGQERFNFNLTHKSAILLATISAMANAAVSPGDSIPIR